ncbi:hypothetical protein WJX81_006673 [Elliptochloris bilobata]|uniref:Histone-lysine N-methyltransferase n=1 Tax=Elliptochloris bilobata TaxID=381761 RepID=A0AAW1R2F4_9CHLO
MLRDHGRELRGGGDVRYVDAGGAGAHCGQAPGEAHYPLQSFRRGHLVLARNVNRSERYWPAVVVDPARDVPERVRQIMQPGKLCLMFYGPAANKLGRRDICWASEADVLPLGERLEDLRSHRRRPGDAPFEDAVREALLVERGLAHPLEGAPAEEEAAPAPCVSCEAARSDWEVRHSGEMGGRCTRCQRLYDKGNYCPVCNRTWTMSDCNMVGCDSCDFWVHDHCDPGAAVALAAGSEDVPYQCPRCVAAEDPPARGTWGPAAQAQLAKLREVRQALRDSEPRRPRTSFQLFVMDVHRVHGARMAQYSPDEVAHKVREAWRAMAPERAAPYEAAVAKEREAWEVSRVAYARLQQRYQALHLAAQQAGLIDAEGVIQEPPPPPRPPPRRPPPPRSAAGSDGGSRGRSAATSDDNLGVSGGSRGTRNRARAAQSGLSGRKRERAPSEEDWSSEEDSPPPQPRRPPLGGSRARGGRGGGGGIGGGRASAGGATSGEDIDEDSIELPVVCGDKRGTFLLGCQRVVCDCAECARKARGDRELTCTQFEVHSGAGAAKKWKSSMRVRPGGAPEVPAGGPGMPVGKWLELRGLDVRGSRGPGSGAGAGVVSAGAPRSAAAAAPAARVKAEERAAAAAAANGGVPYEPWLAVARGEYQAVKVRWAGDRCSVCDSDVDFDTDQLMSCDACGLTVHQSCYGVAELPGVDDMWLCRACELKEEGAPAPQCCLCPVNGGALKPAEEEGLWCHVTCMQWVPEVTVADTTTMEPVSHIYSIVRDRWELMCCFCKQRMGAKIQCTSCYTAYHPLCARIAGMRMEILDSGDGREGPDAPVRMVSYCPRHCTARPELSGVAPLAPEDAAAAAGDDGNGLWNAQPFRQPPAVPIPQCAAGCARAQPLEDGWERASHGTGVGFSSHAGFWMPTRPPPPPPRAALDAYGDPNPGRTRRAAARAPRRHGRPGEDGDGDSGPMDISIREPELARLEPLAPGVPESVPVVCAGRTGLLHVRTQRVAYVGGEVSASRFETLCGKGDAKKWKTSIWLAGENNSQEMVMQDWLAERKLDRKALAALAANAAAVEAYADHARCEVAAVLDDLVDAVMVAGAGQGKRARGAGAAQRPSAAPDAKPAMGLEEELRRRMTGAQEVADEDAEGAKPGFYPEPDPDAPDAAPRRRAEVVGARVRVEWPDDEDWYEAVVRAYSAATRRHNLWYPYDEQAEWLDLGTEEAAGRLIWLTDTDAVRPSVADAAAACAAAEARAAAGGGPGGDAAIGWRIGVWWRDDQCFYYGCVDAYDAGAGKHLVHYDDDVREWLDLRKERVDWQQGPPEEEQAPQQAAGLTAAAARLRKPDGPSGVGVCCNGLRGAFDALRVVITLGNGKRVSPTEFERLAGKAASKKWKASLRVDKGGGVPGRTIGDWLIDAGLDTPKAARPKAPSLNALRRRQGTHMRAGAGRAADAGVGAGGSGKPGHREGCLCVICKQARRTGRLWAGMGTGGPAVWAPSGGARGSPQQRVGKRAYVRACPQLLGGPLRTPLWALPPSRAWAPADYLAAHASAAAAADPDSDPRCNPSTESEAGPDALTAELAPGDGADAMAVSGDESNGGGGGGGGGGDGRGGNGGKAARERKSLTAKERLELCRLTEAARVTFGKSGIHGWGLFARAPLAQDSMVIEYRGELVRRATADARERRYRAAGRDCYLFNVNAGTVVDATQRGTIGRFTNHCCAPSMYTRVLDVDGAPRLAFFARTDIRPGQELTYDYRFKEEAGEDKLPCGCGAPNCRGYLN